MKKFGLAATAALVLATMGTAQADNRSATVAVLETIPEVCNIGLVAGGNDGGVGNSGLSSKYRESGEINLIQGSNQQITGGVKCNAANGFEVTVNVANGVLQHQTNPNKHVPYSLVIDQSGYDVAEWSAIPQTAELVSISGNSARVHTVGSSTSLEEIQFRLQMKDMDFSNVPAGSYNETVTFSITTL